MVVLRQAQVVEVVEQQLVEQQLADHWEQVEGEEGPLHSQNYLCS